MNLERTALNVGCARARGETTESLTTELESARAGLCADPGNCKALETLLAFAKAEAPTKL